MTAVAFLYLFAFLNLMSIAIVAAVVAVIHLVDIFITRKQNKK